MDWIFGDKKSLKLVENYQTISKLSVLYVPVSDSKDFPFHLHQSGKLTDINKAWHTVLKPMFRTQKT